MDDSNKARLSSVVLIPISPGKQKELLGMEVANRHSCVSDEGDDENGRSVWRLTAASSKQAMVSLGRSTVPQISDASIPRHACDVLICSANNTVLLQFHRSRSASARQQKVHVNGKMHGIDGFHELKDGDVVSLGNHGEDLLYSYFVRFEKKDEANSPEIDDKAIVALARELECPLCFSIMVKPTVLVPCGHGMCSECTKQYAAKQCPTCSTSIQSTVVPYALDKTISALAENNTSLKVFPKGDAEEYNRRTGKEVAANSKESVTPSRKRKKPSAPTPQTEPRPRRSTRRTPSTSTSNAERSTNRRTTRSSTRRKLNARRGGESSDNAIEIE